MGKKKVAVKQVTLIDADDWCGLYVDGKSVFQGHSIGIREFVETLQGAGVEFNFSFADGSLTEGGEEAVGSDGCLPDDLAEVDWQ